MGSRAQDRPGAAAPRARQPGRDSAVLPASQAAQVRERHFIERAFRGILSLDNQGPWPIVVGEEPTVYSRRLS